MDAMEKDFDPELHEAITQIPVDNKKMIGKVVDVIEEGYYLEEKVLRHAKVVVGKTMQTTNADAAPQKPARTAMKTTSRTGLTFDRDSPQAMIYFKSRGPNATR